MMTLYRARNLPLHRLCNMAFRLPSQDSIFLPTSTILCSKGANFSSIFTPFSSISQTLVNSKRFYGVHPSPPPSTPTHDDDDDEDSSIKGALEWYFAKSFQTVPYTNRTRRVLYSYSIDTEIQADEFISNRLKQRLMENEDMLLSPTHPDFVRVKMVFNKIIDGLQKDLKKMGNATSSYNSIAERILMTLSRKTPPASTSHLDGLDWEVLVVNYDPDAPNPNTWTRFRYSVCDGKTQYIVVAHGLVNLFVGKDIELAVILSQVVCITLFVLTFFLRGADYQFMFVFLLIRLHVMWPDTKAKG